jgi:hypothetical protein
VKLNSIMARLVDEVPSFRLVGGAAEFERAANALAALPAAFVLPATDTAEENNFMGQLVQQKVTLRFAVLIAARNLADDEGAAAVESLEPLRAAVRDALLNWRPDGADDGCEYANGSLVAFTNGTLWWQDFFTTTYIIRSAT